MTKQEIHSWFIQRYCSPRLKEALNINGEGTYIRDIVEFFDWMDYCLNKYEEE